MENSNTKLYIGLGKVLFNSSVCCVQVSPDGPDVEIFLSERLTRTKADGSWPEVALAKSGLVSTSHWARISDNRDVLTPSQRENELDKLIPFLDYLKKKNLDRFSSVLNSEITFTSHHLAHANVAKFMSPFDEAAILVLDGAGSEGPVVGEEKGSKDHHEEASVYYLKNGTLELKLKEWQKFTPSKKSPGRWFSEGLGTCYELIAEYIFNSKRAAGKVMGLAAFGQAKVFKSSLNLLESLDWNLAFAGHTKKEWEESEHLEHYQNIAASVQLLFEKELEKKAKIIKDLLPDVENLIIIGGCALNCVSNQKLLEKKIFKSIYVPPNPGDEGIGLGCALNEYYKENSWEAFGFERQHGYFGPKESIPNDKKIEEVFKEYSFKRYDDIEKSAAHLIADGEVIAWFQGRSESGPRSLGNRSILARVDKPGLKNYLNREIKFREDFRPYGCSVLQEKAHQYFEATQNFPNPFMSFAVSIKSEFKQCFKEVCHVDGTSRIQTVTKGQNKKFYKLIDEVGKSTGTFAVLNTSLNIMGEPILESITDAKDFFDKTNLKYMVIGDYVVEK